MFLSESDRSRQGLEHFWRSMQSSHCAGPYVAFGVGVSSLVVVGNAGRPKKALDFLCWPTF